MNESNIKQDQQNQSNNDNSNKEIDLLEVGSKAWEGVKSFTNFLIGIMLSLKNFIVFFIVLSIRKSVWILLFTVVGILLGFGYYNLKQPVYTSTLEATTIGVSNSVVINHVNNLERMVSKPELLAELLNMSDEDVKKIRLIKACYGVDVNGDGIMDIIDFNNKYDPVKLNPKTDTLISRVPNLFFIKIQMYDESIVPLFSDKLLQYITENNYIQTLYEIDIQLKTELISELEKEIDKLDTLQMVDVSRKTNRTKAFPIEKLETVFLLGNEPELRLFYTDVLSLYSQKQGLQRSVEIAKKPIIVINDFTPALFEEKPVTYYVIRFAIFMFFVGYACLLLWLFRKRIRKTLVESNIDKEFE